MTCRTWRLCARPPRRSNRGGPARCLATPARANETGRERGIIIILARRRQDRVAQVTQTHAFFLFCTCVRFYKSLQTLTKLTTGEKNTANIVCYMMHTSDNNLTRSFVFAVLYRITSKVHSPDLIFQIRRFFHYRRRTRMVGPEREAGRRALAPDAHR